MIDLAMLQVVRDLVAIFGVVAGFTYYVMTVRNAKRAREAQVFLQINSKVDDGFLQMYFEVMEYDFETFDEFWDKYGPSANRETASKMYTVLLLFENLGSMVREDLFGIRLVARSLHGPVIEVWNKIQPIIDEWRERWNYPRQWSEFEYFYNELMKYMEEHPELKT